MFYKMIDEVNYTYGPEVISAEYQLLTEDKDTYTYPIDGWIWADSENEARVVLGLPEISNEQI